MLSIAPAARTPRTRSVCWWPGAEPGMRLNCIAYTGLCSPKPCGVTVTPSSTPSFAHTASHSPTRLQTAPSVLPTDILSGSCTACRTSKHTVCMRVDPGIFSRQGGLVVAGADLGMPATKCSAKFLAGQAAGFLTSASACAFATSKPTLTESALMCQRYYVLEHAAEHLFAHRNIKSNRPQHLPRHQLQKSARRGRHHQI